LDAERAVVAALGGGCQLPLGAFATREGNTLHVRGVVASPDGRHVIRRETSGPAGDPAAAGRRLADELARAGADAILAAVRR
jgi:hydroxymethylbilane synthase